MIQAIYALLAAGAGCCIAMQAAANSRFREQLNQPLYAAFFSICGTFLIALVVMAALRPPAPAAESFRQTEWWNWIGGPLGALIVLAGAALAGKLGAAVFIAFVVGGQLLSSLVLDHFALLGLQAQPITPGKLLGALLVVAGMCCIKFA